MITPLDIENKKFSKKAISGYSTEEVDDFLDELTIDYEKIYKEVNESRKTIESLNADIAKYRQMETTLQNTLLMAQNAADEIKNGAQSQVDAMLNDARAQADSLVSNAQASAQSEITRIDAEIQAKRKELDDMQRRCDEFKSKMEAMLISELELLKK